VSKEGFLIHIIEKYRPSSGMAKSKSSGAIMRFHALSLSLSLPVYSWPSGEARLKNTLRWESSKTSAWYTRSSKEKRGDIILTLCTFYKKTRCTRVG
jgi:hypothetical protein